MTVELKEIVGKFASESQRFENDGRDPTIVGRLEDKTVIYGQVEGKLQSGLRYRFHGNYRNHPQHGRQFCFSSYSQEAPYGRDETIAYLMQLDSVGRVTAESIWEKHAENSIEVLKKEPDKCVGLARQFTAEKAEAASEQLQEWDNFEPVKIGLGGMFKGIGFPKKTLQRAIDAWGLSAVDVIRNNPYRLMQFPGCGFNNTDELFVKICRELPPKECARRLNKLKRQALCLAYALKSNSDGHTWFDCQKYVFEFLSKLTGTIVRPQKAVELATRGKLIRCRRDPKTKKLYITDAQKANSEWSVAFHAVRLKESKHPIEWPDAGELEGLSEHQTEQVKKALSTRFGMLTGSPGTGKSHVTSRLARWIVKNHGSPNITLCAPTAKAAQRINEMLSQCGISSVRATTIHRLLGVADIEEGGDFRFMHNYDSQLASGFGHVDECSMTDSSLMSSLLSAIPDDGQLLLIGDRHQLSPVGHGCPFFDLIRSSRFGVGELTEIHRNSGAIVRACKDIREKHTFKTTEKLDIANGDNFVGVECNSAEKQLAAVIKIIQDIKRSKKYDPVWDCQIIVAVNEASPVSRRILNKKLQDHLNPTGFRVKGNPFRVDDKVINRKNNWCILDDEQDGADYESNEDGKVRVANGEIGRVLEVRPRSSIIEMVGRNFSVMVGHSEVDEESLSTGSNWELAYGATCHNFQGSECPIGIVMVDESPAAKMVCSREWILTAISRPRVACFLVGKMSTARSFCLRSSLGERKTFLCERIEELLATENLEEFIANRGRKIEVA